MTTRRNRWRGATAGLAAAVMVLSACGPDETAEGAASSSEIDEWLQAKGNDQFNSGPMAEYLGYDDQEAMTDLYREQSKKQQQNIVECMREEGFEYVAFDPMGSFDPGDFDPYDGLTREEYTKKWGYGIATTTAADGGSVDDAPGAEQFNPDETPEDPNMKIREGLSAQEQEAYDKALYGDMSSISGDGGSIDGAPAEGDAGGSDLDDGGGDTSGSDKEGGDFEMPNFEEMGCMGRSMSESFGFGEEDMAEMGKAEEEMQKRVEADKRVKDAAKQYRTCMKEAGYDDIKEPGDAQSSISEQMDKLWSDASESQSGDGDLEGGEEGLDPEVFGSEVDGGDISSSMGGVAMGGMGELDADKLKKLQKDEKELAVAELPCLAAYELTQQKVRFEAEKDFIEKNPELLERLKKSFG